MSDHYSDHYYYQGYDHYYQGYDHYDQGHHCSTIQTLHRWKRRWL
jgi:hypothetical protein